MAMAARRSYDVAFKLKAVAAAETSSKWAASHQFKVDGKRLREWCAFYYCNSMAVEQIAVLSS